MVRSRFGVPLGGTKWLLIAIMGRACKLGSGYKRGGVANAWLPSLAADVDHVIVHVA